MCDELESLTPRQLEVYRYIASFIGQYGYGPTFRELGKMLGITSPCGVQGHLLALQAKGVLDWEPRKSRTIHLLVSESPQPCP